MLLLCSPFAASALDAGLMVRRVAAMEGEEMESDDPKDEGFRIPQVQGAMISLPFMSSDGKRNKSDQLLRWSIYFSSALLNLDVRILEMRACALPDSSVTSGGAELQLVQGCGCCSACVHHPIPGPSKMAETWSARLPVLGQVVGSDFPHYKSLPSPAQGHCWVLADNDKLVPPHVIDSRTFGPLPLSNVVGRVLYSARSEVDHGPVENSLAAMMADAPVVEQELDLELLCRGGDAEGQEEGGGDRQ